MERLAIRPSRSRPVIGYHDEIEAHYLNGDLRAAQQLIDRYGDDVLADPRGCTLAAAVAMARGDLTTSLKPLARAAQLSPGSAVAWHNYGQLLRQTGDAAEAASAFARAATLAPQEPDHRFAEGQALADLAHLLLQSRRCEKFLGALFPLIQSYQSVQST